ncbi:MAG: glycosyltransferase [Deltaproteobacteria bacterium]|nr:glycosyltransferase [Deltaproteobacteria bacterium]
MSRKFTTRHRLSILQVITQRRFSGAERICLALSEELQRRGHSVTLLCKPNGNMPEIARELGITTLTPRISGKLNLWSPLAIASIAARIKADIIHTHLSTAALWGSVAGRISGLPVLAHVHAMNSRHCYILAEMIATCSQGVRQHLINQGVAPEQVRVAYNGVDMRRFDNLLPPAEVRQTLQIPTAAPLIGCVAHLSAKKGQEFLLRAVALLTESRPDLHCLLIGEGEMLDELRELAGSLGIAERVHLLGFRSDAIQLINTMDILILPSIAKEGLGLALVEAALLGKPTIASNAPGIDEALQDGVSGILVPPGNPSELASALERLLADPALRMRMGEAGRKRALETFTVPAMTDQVEALYYELIEKRNK